MELKGRLLESSKNLLTGALRMTFEVASIPPGVERLPEGDLSITVKRWRQKRSLTANAYYWTIVGKIADTLGTSQPFVHNMLLRDFGQLDIVSGKVLRALLPDTDAAEERALVDPVRHLRPTSETVTLEGTTYRVYQELKGSSRYDSFEFSLLLGGALYEAKNMGIETLPPEEIERMMRNYEVNRSA